MFSSKRQREGYFLRDDRVSGGQMLESATITCKHCHRVVVLNPLRTRSRGYCQKCDHYICDWCEAERVRTGECRPLEQTFDELRNAAVKAGG